MEVVGKRTKEEVFLGSRYFLSRQLVRSNLKR